MATKPQRGVEFDCGMYDVRCTQECASDGLRHTNDCPYDNYNTKRSEKMANNSNKNTAPANRGGGNNNGFTPTFRKLVDMTQGERDAFKQGATTANNGIKERLGLKKPKSN